MRLDIYKSGKYYNIMFVMELCCATRYVKLKPFIVHVFYIMETETAH